MIKTDGNRIYITCGEACRILRVNGGRLESVCFGKRVEPEDDIAALGGGFTDELSPDTVSVVSGGKNLVGELVVKEVSVSVKSDDACVLPTLRGDKAVKVVMETPNGALRATLFYAPYIRGGIARRAVFTNTGEKPIEVKRACAGGLDVPLGAEIKDGDGRRIGKKTTVRSGGHADHFTVSVGADERRGDCYGVYLLYGGSYAAAVTENRIDVGLDFMPFGSNSKSAAGYKLAPGESFMTPELLTVFSDNGEGGLMRAVHDILREHLFAEDLPRKPLALMYGADGALSESKLCAAAETTGKLGLDTFVVRLDGAINEKTLGLVKKAADTCKTAGLRSGVSFEPSGGADDIYRVLRSFYDVGVRHFVFRSKKSGGLGACTSSDYDGAVSLYGLLSRHAEEFPDSVIEGGGAVDLAALRYVPYYGVEDDLAEACAYRYNVNAVLPPCALCGYVTPDAMQLKTAFDLCSLGVLAYRADPEKLGEGMGRAVRAQIFAYQDDRALVENGDLYRLCEPSEGFGAAVVSKDKSAALAVYINTGGAKNRLKFYGVDEHNLYHVRELDKTFSGAALVGYGIDVSDVREGESVSFRLRQVADYEM